jgi:hypothetical protein
MSRCLMSGNWISETSCSCINDYTCGISKLPDSSVIVFWFCFKLTDVVSHTSESILAFCRKKLQRSTKLESFKVS